MNSYAEKSNNEDLRLDASYMKLTEFNAKGKERLIPYLEVCKGSDSVILLKLYCIGCFGRLLFSSSYFCTGIKTVLTNDVCSRQTVTLSRHDLHRFLWRELIKSMFFLP